MVLLLQSLEPVAKHVTDLAVSSNISSSCVRCAMSEFVFIKCRGGMQESVLLHNADNLPDVAHIELLTRRKLVE